LIEIFSHDIFVTPDPEAQDVLIIKGKGWEGEPFHLYLNETEAANLLWQLNFYVGTEE
jgi:hypothetical protein